MPTSKIAAIDSRKMVFHRDKSFRNSESPEVCSEVMLADMRALAMIGESIARMPAGKLLLSKSSPKKGIKCGFSVENLLKPAPPIFTPKWKKGRIAPALSV